MKNTISIFLPASILLLFSCTSTYKLTTRQGTPLSIVQHKPSGVLDMQFDRLNLHKELTALVQDSLPVKNQDVFFEKGSGINRMNPHHKRSGIWITASNRNVTLANYRNGKKHGTELILQTGNESKRAQYKRGRLHGWSEYLFNNMPYQRWYYKRGVVRKAMIISPSW